MKIPMRVKVKFLVNRVDTEEVYNLDNLSDMTTWRANEALTAAIQTGLEVLEEKEVTQEEYNEIVASRTKLSSQARAEVKKMRKPST